MKRYGKVKKSKERSDPDMNLEYLDYWSKYYAALNVKRKEMKSGVRRRRKEEDEAGGQLADETDEEIAQAGFEGDGVVDGMEEGKRMHGSLASFLRDKIIKSEWVWVGFRIF